MHFLLSPAVSLMNRLRYRKKFMLVGAVAGLVLMVLLFTIFRLLNTQITVAQHELSGVAVLKPLNQLTQAMQQHRGLSAGVLGGNEAMKDKRAAKAKDVEAAMAASEAVLVPELRDGAEWKQIREVWKRVQEEGLELTAAENFRQHTAVIGQVLGLMVTVADTTELTLDPAIDTYYMMDTVVSKMPVVLESLGQLRARGTGVLAKKAIVPQIKIDIAATLAELESTQRTQDINLGKVMHHAPALQGTLSAISQEFGAHVAKVKDAVRNDVLSESFGMPSQDYFSLATVPIDHGYKTMYEVLLPGLERQLHERIDDARRELAVNVSLAVLAVLIMGYLAAGTYLAVMNSVAVFSEGAQRLAEGDLTVRFELRSRDEMHDAAEQFNAMASAIRQLLGRVQDGVQQLQSAAEQLASSSAQISASTSSQSDSASSMAASVEQMTVGVDHIARNAEEAQKYSNESDAVTAEGGRIVGGVVEEIRRIAETVNQSASAVEELGRHSDRISAIVGTIKEIADQTNLLALNAAIEAARAGETGRGFAVVADEVRKLAERTGKSTQEIADMIASIQSGTEVAVNSMKQGVERVASGVGQAQAAGEVIHQVLDHSHHVVAAVDEISNALREQAAASTEIAKNVERIAQMAEENNAAAAANASTAGELRRLAEDLGVAVGRFRT